MSEIEFLQPAAPEPPPEPPARHRRAARVDSRLVPVAWVVIAGMSILAPFLTFFVQSSRLDDGTVRFATDGWGREHVTAPDTFSFAAAGHQPRFGVALVLCAALLLVAAGAQLVHHARWAAMSSRCGQLGAAACVLLVGTALTLGLDAESQFSTRDAINHQSVGAGWWLAIAAAALGVITTAVDHRRLLPDH